MLYQLPTTIHNKTYAIRFGLHMFCLLTSSILISLLKVDVEFIPSYFIWKLAVMLSSSYFFP